MLTLCAASIVRDTLFLLIPSGDFIMAELLPCWWRHHVSVLSCHTDRADNPFALRTRTLLLPQKQTVVSLFMRKHFSSIYDVRHLTFHTVAVTLRRSVSCRVSRLLLGRYVL
jgi:hypothetical protein